MKEAVLAAAIAVSIIGYFIVPVNFATIYHLGNKADRMEEDFETRQDMGISHDQYEGMWAAFAEPILIMITVPVLIFIVTVFSLEKHSGGNCILPLSAFSSFFLAHVSLCILLSIHFGKNGRQKESLTFILVAFVLLFISGGLYYLIRKRKECLALEHRVYYLTGLFYGIPGILAEIHLLAMYSELIFY